jgi:hypothetical protein
MAVDRDMNHLVPAFRALMDLHLQHLRDDGHDPRVHETLRGKARAAWLVLRGKSRARGGLSMHCFGVACDVICGRHKWSCHKFGCDFYEAQGRVAKAVGLVWGGDWDGDGDTKDQSFDDRPHLQAVPLRLQAAIRKMRPELINDFVAQYLASKMAA